MPNVDVLVADEALDAVPELLTLLEAEEVTRKPDTRSGVTRLTIDMSYVPDGATEVDVVFQRVDNTTRVQTLSWSFGGK